MVSFDLVQLQSLIGWLQTDLFMSDLINRGLFQSLIGWLQTYKEKKHKLSEEEGFNPS